MLLRSALPSGSGNNVTVLELAAAEVRSSPSGRSVEMASETLPFLLPGMGYEWMVECGGRSMTASSPDRPRGSDIYCSTVEADMPWGQVVYRLRAWAI